MADRHAGRRHLHPTAALEDELDGLQADLDTTAARTDARSGLVPVWARRGLHPWELAARVSFAAIDQHESSAAASIGRRLEDDRSAFLDLLIADLERQPSGRAVVDRLLELETAGLGALPGTADLLQASAGAHLGALQLHASEAATMAAAEAAAQHVRIVDVLLDAHALGQLEQLAQRLAVAPQVDLVKALRDLAVRLPTPASASLLTPVLRQAGTDLSPRPLAQQAQAAINQANGLGRQATAATVAPANIYASELLDGNTCGPCSFIDGTNYATLAEARADYPSGQYVRCEGGDRCRGTLVYVWDEAPPTF